MTYRRLSKQAEMWAAAANNPLTDAMASQSGTWIDMITANPHEHGLAFPQDILQAALDAALPATRVYRPHPLGQAAARDAVRQYYQSRGFKVEDVILTPGTSVSYFYLLRLLLNPGDEVLVPRPGYPLFEDLAATAGVRLRTYQVGRDIDVEDLAFQITARTKAVVVVSPHNPLGTVVSAESWKCLGEVCQRHQVALVLDEVFCEFLTEGAYPRPDPADFPLLCVLNGVSKMFSLPGYKLGWIAVTGDSERLMKALEYLSDVFLPVSELAQAAAPAVLEAGAAVSEHLAESYRHRRRVLEEALPVLPADGGVYACLPLPEGMDEDALVLRALQQHGVLVHPGHYYQLPGHLVMTCVAAPEQLQEGAARLLRAF